MKRLSTILALLLLSIAVLAQVPQQFTYQALICDAENEIISNRVITVQLSIVTANDSVVYSEMHQTTTNENGVVSLAVGTGTTNDNFSQIDWSKGEYYLQTVADLGADEQLVSGISPLLSVPYAFYAEKAGNTTESNLTNYVKKTDLNIYAKPSALPTKISELPNDANYITLNEVPQPDMSNYYSKAEFDALLANLRSELAAGGGNSQHVGAIEATFSISDSTQIYFSQGNLQYQASTGIWRFAENQWDHVGTQTPDDHGYYGGTIEGSDNTNVSSTYDGWIDLFCWGTSGWNSGANAYQPYSTSEDDEDYYPGRNDNNNLTGSYAKADWGVYNAISNGGNKAGQWRTLTLGEWDYVIYTRANASSKKGVASVNGVNGLILLPDSWTLPTGLSFTSGVARDYGSEYYKTVNNYTLSEWSKMEANGAVFLPAAGDRDGTVVNLVGYVGMYWSSTTDGSDNVYYLCFDSGFTEVNDYGFRGNGRSVRLVQDVETTSSAVLPTITTGEATEVAISSATVSGTVTNDGGASVTERGVCWATTENPTISDNKLASGNGIGEFTVSLTNLSAGTTYYARAYATNSVGTAYGNVVTFTTESEGGNVTIENGAIKAGFSISSNRQIYFSQGNLQFNAMQGTHACADGTTQQGTWRFADNQWDYVGDATNGTVYENGVKCNNANVSESYTGWIDLFAWGTSGWNSGANAYQPYSTSGNQEDYYPGNSCINDLTGNYANADWGVYNAISNGGNQTGQWRTLSYQEWSYITSRRNDAANKRGVATVNNIIGFILLPDDWTLPSGITFYNNYSKEGFSLNNYTLEDWAKMEANGAVFFPAAGGRNFSQYWFSSSQGCSYIDYLSIGQGYGWGTNDGEWANSACAVRLVQDVKTTSSAVLPTITTGEATEIAISSATVSGNVTSDGGASVTERGVCWATTENPTISDNKIASGNGTGEFSVSLTNLSEGTTYYARAYATYSEGTVYGNKVIFTTKSNNSVSNTIVENGAIKAGFSVSDTNQVYFSQGNLQYQASTGTWRFAERQYYMLGDDNANISSSYNGWIDLFGWGTSGWNSGANEYQPYSTSTSWGNYCPGGSYVVDLTGDYARADWGVYNAISNGGNKAGLWRTLTYSEWTYLLNTRTDASSKKGIATVNGVNGLILLPDNWTLPDGLSFRSEVANDFGEEYYATVNNYTASDWDKMEANGALFLPAAGIRSGNFVSGTELWGHYWSTSSLDNSSYCLIFMSKNFEYGIGVSRYNGLSVRLVQDVESTSSAVLPTISTGEATEVAVSSATVSGSVTSDGGASITERGVCWATTENPTISDNKLTNGSGTGEFTVSLTNLSAGTIYYARAYAINTAGIAYGNEVTFTTESEGGNVTIENGAIKAGFSVAEGKQVYFSQGNLQFNAVQGTHACADGTTQQGTWRFAENQYDIIGEDNTNISSSYNGWIDLFGWGTSGYNGKTPYMTSSVNSDYGDGENDIAGTNYDWGVYNAISNGGNQIGQWRTLTGDEWYYLIMERPDESNKRGGASVNGVNGLILLPDYWTMPDGLTFNSGRNSNYALNTYSTSDWSKMEANGAVFLPAAGYRSGNDVGSVETIGDYWSSSIISDDDAYSAGYGPTIAGAVENDYLYAGLSVRLVQNVETTSSAVLPTITTGEATEVAILSAIINGNVTSDGGASVTERGVCWATTENPTISDNKNFSSSNGTGEFTILLTNLSAGTTYYARAYATNSIGTAYGNVVTFTTEDEGGNVTIENGAIKAGFSVAEGKQVYFSQGNLQFNAVQGTHACADGTTQQGTWRFAEHQYDMVGADNKNISETYDGWIDLFGWGTSGFDDKYPYMSSEEDNDYGDALNDIAGTFYDWGMYNAISNGGNQARSWRTLTIEEWLYLLNTRTDAASKYGVACVNGVNGFILIPDDWVLPDGVTFTSGMAEGNGSSYYATVNNYTLSEWDKMEENGAVFLPETGLRNYGTNYRSSDGCYWSSNVRKGQDYAEVHYFNSRYVNTGIYGALFHAGESVRLVQDVETTSAVTPPIITTGNATGVSLTSATVSGNVIYDGGATVTIRGICWATTPNPTISDNKRSNGNALGRFSVSLTNLSEGTTYYARAYAINSEGTVYGNEITFTPSKYIGAIKVGFSVSDDKQVYFSQGNLQYQASTDTWRFAEHQYDMIGEDNTNISSSYNGWIDLFGWGTSGWNSGANAYQPYSISTKFSDYYPGGSSSNNLTDDYANADWGVYNNISNGGNQAGMWRTLTKVEWYFLINTRTNASSKKALATVNDVAGLILLPDNWTLPEDLTFTSGTNDYAQNTYYDSDWSKMEANGAVFLPAAGRRNGVNMKYVGEGGYYWSSSYNLINACSVYFVTNNVGVESLSNRHDGFSVRLVQDAE